MKHDIELPWNEFKVQVLDTGKWKWIYFDSGGHYVLCAKQNAFSVLCKIYKDSGADQTAFEASYKANATSEIADAVQSRFERDDIVLKLAHVSGQADASGDLVLSIKVPGTIGSEVRYAAGGYAFTDAYAWTDKVLKVEVVDEDNILGLGAGVVVKSYHDTGAPAANQGWPFWKSHGNEGECEIEPMGWYGCMPSGLYLKTTLKVAASAKVKVALFWGRIEA